MQLSVVTTTYNSENFIEDTMLGVLNQELDIPFEYLISDDASSDNTLKMVEEIKKEHPKGCYIKILQNESNQGVMKNFFKAVLATRGKYIAFCDSDDLWEDSYKAQKQLNYLEGHPGVSMVYHAYINKADERLDTMDCSQFEEPINELLPKPQTSTVMVRGILRDKINWKVVAEAAGPQNDQYFRFLLSDEGEFHLLRNIKPNVRVVRENSIFSTVDKLEKKEKALHSWQAFYKYHGVGLNRKWLAGKVIGFQSAVYWLEFKKYKAPNLFIKAIQYDLREGLWLKKIIKRLKQLVFYPYHYIKQKSIN